MTNTVIPNYKFPSDLESPGDLAPRSQPLASRQIAGASGYADFRTKPVVDSRLSRTARSASAGHCIAEREPETLHTVVEEMLLPWSGGWSLLIQRPCSWRS